MYWRVSKHHAISQARGLASLFFMTQYLGTLYKSLVRLPACTILFVCEVILIGVRLFDSSSIYDKKVDVESM